MGCCNDLSANKICSARHPFQGRVRNARVPLVPGQHGKSRSNMRTHTKIGFWPLDRQFDVPFDCCGPFSLKYKHKFKCHLPSYPLRLCSTDQLG